MGGVPLVGVYAQVRRAAHPQGGLRVWPERYQTEGKSDRNATKLRVGHILTWLQE